MYFSITGVAGSGKTFILSSLIKKGYVGVNQSIFFKKKQSKYQKLVEQNSRTFIPKEFEITFEQISNIKLQNKKKIFFIEGIQSHLFPKIKGVIFLTAPESVLISRLKKRAYAEEKIMENVLAQKEEVFLNDLKKRKTKFIQIDTSKSSIDEQCTKIEKFILDLKEKILKKN